MITDWKYARDPLCGMQLLIPLEFIFYFCNWHAKNHNNNYSKIEMGFRKKSIVTYVNLNILSNNSKLGINTRQTTIISLSIGTDRLLQTV